ncbi:MAG TPA: GNAT family N-acetyltransferase [Ktedonobacterales bacterium]
MTTTDSRLLLELYALAAPEWWECATPGADWARKEQAMAPDQLRPRAYAGECDLRAIVELLLSAQAAEPAFDWLSAGQLRALLADPAFDRARDLRLWVDTRGALVACALLWAGNTLLWFSRPAARGEALDALVVAWGASRAREVAAPDERITLRTETRDPQTQRIASLARLGFVPQPGHALRMRRALAESLTGQRTPAGYRIRPLAEGELGAWLALAGELFPQATRLPLSVGRRRALMADAAYTPDLDLVAETETGALVGFCHAALRPDERERLGRRAGWIELLGVAPAQRGAGLGRALLRTGLLALADYGADEALLTVRADNTAAQALYAAEGFIPLHAERTWTLTLD